MKKILLISLLALSVPVWGMESIKQKSLSEEILEPLIKKQDEIKEDLARQRSDYWGAPILQMQIDKLEKQIRPLKENVRREQEREQKT